MKTVKTESDNDMFFTELKGQINIRNLFLFCLFIFKQNHHKHIMSISQNTILQHNRGMMAIKVKSSFAFLLRPDDHFHQTLPLDCECLMHECNKKGFLEGKRWSSATNTQSLLRADLKAFCFNRAWKLYITITSASVWRLWETGKAIHHWRNDLAFTTVSWNLHQFNIGLSVMME